MLLKLGVAIDKLNPEIRRSLVAIETVYNKYGYEPVITATYDGNHKVSSLHYRNDAVDLRLPGSKVMNALCVEMRTVLGKNFDVVLESDHIHVEYDPK